MNKKGLVVGTSVISGVFIIPIIILVLLILVGGGGIIKFLVSDKTPFILGGLVILLLVFKQKRGQ